MSLLHTWMFFLRATWRNRTLQFLRRLRSPRYALALIIGAVYFFLAFGGSRIFRDGTVAAPGFDERLNVVVAALGPLFLVLLSAFWWIRGGRQALAFTPAEAALLVPAPLTRRQLVQFKLLQAQPATILTALLFTVLARGAVLPFGIRFLSTWALFIILHLHQVGAGLVRTSVQQQGKVGLQRMWPAIVIFASIILTLLWATAAAWPAVSTAESTMAAIERFAQVYTSFPASIAIAPFRAAIAPVAATTLAAWQTAFMIALLIIAAHYAWVMRVDAAFEESAVEAGAVHAARVEAVRRGKRVTWSEKSTTKIRKPWFALPSSGEPAYAIWWKNVLQITRNTSPLLIGIVLATPLILVGIVYQESESAVKATAAGGAILLTFGVMAMFMGPLAVRNDLRSDLSRVELLRTLPLGGARLVAAEVMASAMTIFVIQFFLLAAGGSLLLAGGEVSLPPVALLAVIPAILLLIALDVTMVLIHNGFALFFPAWAKIGPGNAPGVEHFGQNILTLIGTLFFFVLSLVAPLFMGGAAVAGLALELGPYAAVAGGLVFIATFYAQAAIAIIWLGGAYDRLDPVAAGLCK